MQELQAINDKLSQLTARELRVFDLIGAGRMNKQIAKRFDCSVRTVENIRAKIYSKLGISTAAQLGVLYGLRKAYDAVEARYVVFERSKYAEGTATVAEA